MSKIIDNIGKEIDPEEVAAFMASMQNLNGSFEDLGINFNSHPSEPVKVEVLPQTDPIVDKVPEKSPKDEVIEVTSTSVEEPHIPKRFRISKKVTAPTDNESAKPEETEVPAPQSVDKAHIQEIVDQAKKAIEEAETKVVAKDIQETIPEPGLSFDTIMTRLNKKNSTKTNDDISDDISKVADIEEPTQKDKKTFKKGKIFLGVLGTTVVIALITGSCSKKNKVVSTPIPTAISTPNPTPEQNIEVTPTPTPEVVIDPKIVANDYYQELLKIQNENLKFNLKNGVSSIENIIYTLQPSLGLPSNLAIDEASELCNNITGKTITNNHRCNLSKLLYTYDEKTLSLIDELETAAVNVKSENFNGEFAGMTLYDAEQKAYAEENGVDPSDDIKFFETLNNTLQELDKLGTKNVATMVVIDAIYNGAIPNLTNYVNHYEDGAKADTDFRMLETEMFSEENLAEFVNENALEINPEVNEEVVKSSAEEYYKYLQDIENAYNTKFNKVESLDTIKLLTDSLNDAEKVDPTKTYDIFYDIATICKEVGVDPKFDTLIANEKYAKLVKDIYAKLQILKVDSDYEDDKKLHVYLAENLLDDETKILNYYEDNDIATFTAIMAMFDSYKSETFNYRKNGKNGEFAVNGEPYFSCADGVSDMLHEWLDAVIENYDTAEGLTRSR